MYCEKCGSKIPDNSKFCGNCGEMVKGKRTVKDKKDMAVALLLSFLFSGLGIAYGGNLKRGIVIFAFSLIFYFLGKAVGLCAVIGLLIWIFGLYLTYKQIKISEGNDNPNIIEDFNKSPTPRKIAAVIFIIVVLFIFITGSISAFAPKYETDYSSSSGNSYHDSSPSSSYPSTSGSHSSSSSDHYSSSSNGRNVESHYDGEYGSADTYGTVYDDGSVESHQKGHTKYGDYQIDSYMDSDGNIHGTVESGGVKYTV